MNENRRPIEFGPNSTWQAISLMALQEGVDAGDVMKHVQNVLGMSWHTAKEIRDRERVPHLSDLVMYAGAHGYELQLRFEPVREVVQDGAL